MNLPRFIQIHSLTSYTGVLLNRDDYGLAKREPYGGVIRTRVSSQCCKYAWRNADGIYAMEDALGLEESYRSRSIVTKIAQDLAGEFPGHKCFDEVVTAYQQLVYGKDADTKLKRQPLLLGAPEVRMIASKMRDTLAATAELSVKKDITAALKEVTDRSKIFSTMRENGEMAAGSAAVLFGRMITSDRSANIDAPIHVAHAFTVHGQESEIDLFTVNDAMANKQFVNGELVTNKMIDDDTVDHKGETEINSGIFYGYVSINVPELVSNVTGCDPKDWLNADRELAGRIVAHLLRTIAEVSPGAKKGSTSPYGYAHTLLVEAGQRQPRSLSSAFRTPVKPRFKDTLEAMKDYLQCVDDNYETGEARRFLSLDRNLELPFAERAKMSELQQWVGSIIEQGEA